MTAIYEYWRTRSTEPPARNGPHGQKGEGMPEGLIRRINPGVTVSGNAAQKGAAAARDSARITRS